MDEIDAAILRLAASLRDALQLFETSGGRRCIEGCTCPMSQAIDAAERFIACVDAFERGDLVPGGLPIGQQR